MSDIPSDLHYTAEHEWVRRSADDTVRVGITDFAQSALGDVVFVQLPDVGTELTAGDSFGEVESTKSVSDLYAPVSGKVVRCQRRFGRQSAAGELRSVWRRLVVELQVGGGDTAALDSAIAGLLDAEAYRGTLTE